jgi:hypothetical protein
MTFSRTPDPDSRGKCRRGFWVTDEPPPAELAAIKAGLSVVEAESWLLSAGGGVAA